MKTFDDVLQQLRDMSQNTTQQGNYFERLIRRVLLVSPLFQDEFTNVWLWDDWPGHWGHDVGIDLVAQRKDSGDLVAIQCKFYADNAYLDQSQLNKFFAALGQEPFREGMIFSTTDNWSSTSEAFLAKQTKPVNRVRVQDLRDSGIDWSSFVLVEPEKMQRSGRKIARKHQREAIDAVIEGFKQHDRGQMIMACGTGKTLTSLKLVEEMVPKGGHVLFLVPSISLLQQTLTEWKLEASRSMRAYAVCSDVKVGRKQDDSNEIKPYDLVIPATTDAERLSDGLRDYPADDLTVIFSTYQSISKVSQAQKHAGSALPAFDLVICDEAHRTTGFAEDKKDRSEFLKVHDNAWIEAEKRLYMTATPRIYSDDSKKKVKPEQDHLLASMDDPEMFGPEFHRLGFGRALELDLLSDYKVLILTVSEQMLHESIDFAAPDNLAKKLSMHDAVRIIGCWNGIAKRNNPYTDYEDFAEDPVPMRRAVAFSRSIKDSKHIKNAFASVTNQFIDAIDERGQTRVEVEHVDGTDNVLHRSHMLDWLKQGAPENENVCRILSNARCLSEGVDVPALDAVLFLNPRDSVVDVVQSVGRVMRKAEGKNFGYIILPIPVPPDMSPEEALNDNTNYKVVWSVLQALRAHDDRFNAMINKLELNKRRDETIKVIGAGGKKQDEKESEEKDEKNKKPEPVQLQMDPRMFEQWRDAIFARIVERVGDRRYWDSWAKDIANIATTHIERMQRYLADPDSEQSQAFDRFLARLHEEINPAVSREDAIEMLAQHLITRPVFEALFESEAFSLQNPVSLAMQQMLDDLGEYTLEEERQTLERFYRSVRNRAADIDNAEGRQKVVVELYDKFFRNAFPKMAERLGIVYTPVEVVDYLLHSADYVLKQHFGKGLSDEGVHILDPFTGTGTFITRLLQSGLIQPEDAARKYDDELHANEMVLLAYYIAAVNIETVFQEAFGGEYRPFTGIVWTDTFQMSENEQVLETTEGTVLFRRMNVGGGTTNSERATQQVLTPIKVIVGNPPYSVGQTSANDDNQNLKYPQLDQRIADTYADRSTATLKRNLYDSYVRAIRWASDRIGDQGVIAFVTNASFIDGNSMDGLRSSLAEEFSELWVFNTRGNARTSGEERQKEKGNVFGSGSRAPIALTLFVKDPNQIGPCVLHYHDIGDYLSREEKLDRISQAGDIAGVTWTPIDPNEAHDWVNQRDPTFESFAELNVSANRDHGVFSLTGAGVSTNRDAWVINFSKTTVTASVTNLMDFYNANLEIGGRGSSRQSSNSPDQIKWSAGLIARANRGDRLAWTGAVVPTIYRPYCKQWLYFDQDLNERVSQNPRMFPDPTVSQPVIYASGKSASKEFSALATNVIPNLHMLDSGQSYPLVWFDTTAAPYLSFRIATHDYDSRDGISDFMHRKFQEIYGDPSITKEDLFYYVYGVLHSNEYRERFSADLKKMLPRIPFTEDFWAFSKAGRELGDLHVNYESVEPWHTVQEIRTEMPFSRNGQELDDATLYRVEKMRFPKNGKEVDKTSIIYNQYLTLTGIPENAYAYVVNGRPAIEWLMEMYQVKQDKASKIVNDPNDWSDDPRYIIDLVKRIVRVSIETNLIVAMLPSLNERDVKIEQGQLTF